MPRNRRLPRVVKSFSKPGRPGLCALADSAYIDIALGIRNRNYALNALLPVYRVHNVHPDLHIAPRHSDQIESAADAKHGEPLFSHRLQSNKVKDVIGSFRKEIVDRLDGFALGGVNDVRCAESPCRVESFRLDVDDDNPRRASDARATYCVETNASGAKDHNGVAGADACCIQDGTGTSGSR